MQLLKFLFGIILTQIVTISLILIAPDNFTTVGAIRIGIPLLFIALIIAFWFTTISKSYSQDAINRIKENFAKEKEKIRLSAEEAKRDIEKNAQKEAQRAIIKEATSTHAKANFKVGVAFAGVLGVGALFVFAQMVTVGLLAMSATGGAIGGYYLRGKRLKDRERELKEITHNPNIKVIDTIKKPPQIEKK